MLSELRVANLGVIEELRLVLGPGMTALTGETGAGKTMLVEAIELLVGAKADAALVRPGCDEATVEGRFVLGDDEVVLSRVIPAVGRSRGYVDGKLAPAALLAEHGERLIDLHGQHAHQSLLSPAKQRAALDRFGGVDLEALRAARRAVAAIDTALAELGGDERSRVREIDLLRFQVQELASARLEDADEDERLAADEELLAGAQAHREAATAGLSALAEEGGVLDGLGVAIAAIGGRAPLAGHERRLRDAAAELADAASELRAAAEGIEEDPARLAEVRARRQLLHDLRRKYGDTLADVMAYETEAQERLAELASHDERAATLDRERVAALERVRLEEQRVGAALRRAAPALGGAVQAHLADLAMGKARLDVVVGALDPGDDVTFLLAANPGAPLLALAKVASGGELARTMLALRLVLSGGRDDEGPETLIFDEVDTGIGGSAASAVGAALAALAVDRQVLVVTHLAQVAACADQQIAIAKSDDGATTTAQAAVLDGEARLVELSRMLSGSPASASAQEHAAELLATARRPR